MLVGGLTAGLTLWLLLSPPSGLGTGALFAWLLGTTILCRTAGAVFRIPYLSLGAELSRDYHERTAVAGARALFGLLGTLGAATLSFAVFFPNRVAGVDPKLDYGAYPRMGLAFGLAMTVAAVLSTVGTLRHRQGGHGARVDAPFAAGLRTALRNRAFRGIWWCVTLFYMAVVVNAALGIHYFTHYVRITESDVLARLQLCFYVGALAGVFPWVWLSRRVEKRKLSVASLAATAALMALATALFGEGSLFGTGNPGPLLAGHFLAGACASALWVLPASMMADLADEDELASGHRREGLFFGMVSLGEKMGAGAALLAAGVLLDVFIGFTPGEPVGATAAARLGAAYGLVPAVIAAAAAVALARYPLDQAAISEIQAKLHRQHALRAADLARGA
jgi:GPH family glycoside/pentoside/hexuronide:cation symporter